ncbi:hypothetical protein [Micavibrio aeruginosavorus]|uniref:hypothetical protein n=1 Tax=Micavibrio aeruginosavorus TaxID=349221 RepID=UPI003F4ADAC8
MSNTPPDDVHTDVPSLRADYARLRELRAELDRRSALRDDFQRFAFITAVLPFALVVGMKGTAEKTAHENAQNASGTFTAAFAASARDYAAYDTLQKHIIPTTRDKACMEQNTTRPSAEKTYVLDGDAALKCLNDYDPVHDHVQAKDRIVRDPTTWFLGFLILASLYAMPGAYRRHKAHKQALVTLRDEHATLKAKITKTLEGPL